MDRGRAPGTLAALRVAVISDIHANLPALEAVLAAIDEAGVERDLVPRRRGRLRRRARRLHRRWSASAATLCLVGNHDLAVLGELDISAFSEAAAAAVELDPGERRRAETLEFLRELEPAGERDGVGLFHASPRDPVWEYVLSLEQADACIDAQPERVGLIGHSHVALFFIRAGGRRPRRRPAAPRRATAPSSTSARAAGCSTPAASASPATATPAPPGSSSTPRRWTARYHRVAYDIERRRRGDRRRPGCRSASPTASTSAS